MLGGGAGDTYIFDPYAAGTGQPNYTWSISTNPSLENWINKKTGQATNWVSGGIAEFDQAGALTVTVNDIGGVAPQVEGITFAGGGSTTLNPYSATAGALSFYQTTNLALLDTGHSENPSLNSVANDFVNCPFIVPTGATGALVINGPAATGDIALGSTGNSPPGGVLIQGGSITIGHNTFASSAIITVDTGTGAGSAALAIYDSSSSSVTISNPFVFQAGDLRVDTRGYQVTFGGSLWSPPAPNPTGNLVISDTAANGTLTVSGDASNFRGNVTIISGSLVLSGGNAVGTGNMTVNGGRLDLGSTVYVPPATLSFLSGDIAASSTGYIDLPTSSTTFTVDIGLGLNGFISAPIEGSGNLEVGAPVGGSGLLFLLGNDTYTGTTTVDTGATLIYRWNGRNGEYSIPGGYGTAVIQTGATLKSEYAYFTVVDANAYIWNGDNNGIWENDQNNTDWYTYRPTDPLVNQGPAAVFWMGSGRDAVFEEPVPGGTTPTGQWSDITIEGFVQVDGHMMFMMGSNVIISSGGSQDYLCFGSATPTLLSSPSQNTTQWLYAPLACQSPNGGLKMINPGNVYIGFNNQSRYQYFGTTTLTNADAIQFVGGGLGGDGTGDGSAPVVIDAGSGGTAALVPSNTAPVANSIYIASGNLRVDPAGQQVTLQGAISGPGTFLLGDSVGGGTAVLDPLDANENHTVNTWTGGINIQDGILNVSYDTDLGATTATPNIVFSGNGGLQWASGFGFTLDPSRTIQIDSDSSTPPNPYTATFDTNGNNNCGIGGTIAGTGWLTVVNTSTTNPGVLTLYAATTFTGVTTVWNAAQASTLVLDDPLALQNSIFDTTGTGTLSFDSLTHATFGGLQGAGDLNLENAQTPTQAVTLTVRENDSATTLDGSLTGSGSLVKTGTYILTLNGQDPFTGMLTIAAGTLNVLYLSDTYNGQGTITLGASGATPTEGTLQYIGTTSVTITRGLTGLAGGGEFDNQSAHPFTFAQGATIGASGNLTLGGNNDITTLGQVNVASLFTTVATGHVLDLDGGDSIANTIGQLTVDSGIVIADKAQALNSNGVVLAFGPYSTGVVQLNGHDTTLLGLTTDSSHPGSPVVEVSSDPYPAMVLTVAIPANVTDGYAGALSDGAAGNSLSLAVEGLGTLVLSGVNSCKGGTTVGTGTLVITTAGSLRDGTSLIVGAGGVFIFDPSDPPPSAGQTQDQNGPGRGQDFPVASQPPNGGGDPPPAVQPPVVTAIQCAGPEVCDCPNVTFSILFSEPVENVASGDFTVGGGGTVTSVTSVSGSQYSVTVAVTPGFSGTLGLEVHAGAICDQNNTPLNDVAAISDDATYTISNVLYWTGGPCNLGAGGGCFHLGSEDGPIQGFNDGSALVFDGTSGVVTIPSPINASSVTFLTSGWTVNGSSITLTGSGTPASSPAEEGSTLEIAAGWAVLNVPVNGDLVQTGAGTVVYCGGIACSSIALNGGSMDLDGTTATASMMSFDGGGSVINGTLNVSGAINVYCATVSAGITGTAALTKFGRDTAFLAGPGSYTGRTMVLGGTLIVAEGSLPGTASGPATVIIQPTLYWQADTSGNFITGSWLLADGTPSPWLDGSRIVVGSGASISLTSSVNVSGVTFEGDAAITGDGTLSLPAWGTTIAVVSGTARISVALAGGGFTQTGAGTLVLDGAATVPGILIVDQGTLDLLAPQANPPVVVGGQAIGPGAVFSGNESLYAIDPAMFGLVQSLFVDQTIDRDGMIQILNSAVVAGAVTNDALAALEAITLPQGETALNVPSYVRVLASDVVNGNPSNANYQGQPLGNLTDQGSEQAMATALEDLVGKWFNGTDLPAIDPSSIAAGATYSVVAGSLFGSAQAPSSADMEQGNLGDCYFVAAVGAIADSDPTAIESMFTANGVENGTASYTVRFYYYDPARGYVPDYVTVNTALPVWPNGNLVYEQPGPDGSLWLPLLEKAYAQWNETGNEGRSRQNSYAALAYGFMQQVDSQVLGAAATVSFPAASDLTAKQALIAALQTGAAVTVGCFSDNSQLQLVGGHSYDVAGYDAASDSFMLKNPWGFYQPCALSWGQLCQYCDWLVVAEASSPAATSSLTVGSQAVGASAVEVRASALPADWGRQLMPDAAVVVDVASQGQGDPATSDSLRKAHVRTIDLVLAEYGR